jgi:hypothetical protein
VAIFSIGTNMLFSKDDFNRHFEKTDRSSSQDDASVHGFVHCHPNHVYHRIGFGYLLVGYKCPLKKSA